MHDIVATIAAEQDEIIRAPLEAVVIVQGGPGTGKTAVGLHRAAFLLFEHRAALEDQRVLVIGPNPVFLRYIAEVLPSLGETAVSQSTLTGLLAARTPVRAEDPPEVTTLKGRVEMAEVISAAVSARIRPLPDGLTLRGGSARIHLDAGDLEDLQARVLSGTLPVNQGRAVFRRLIVQEAWRRHAARPGVDVAAEPVITAAFRADNALDAAVAKMWPTLNPAAVVRDLYRSPAKLRAAAAGRLDPDDQARLVRKAPGGLKAEPWTAGDIPLIDEATARIEGVPASYGHVVVDEAQDLSPMALRMAARRAATGSMTVLGDLAQATAPGAPGSWELTRAALAGAMAEPPTVEARELTVGYRVPASILDVANALLPQAAPGVTPARSVRPGGDPPLVLAVADDTASLDHAVVTEAAALRERTESVAVVAPAPMLDRLEASLRAAGVPAERVEGRGLPGREAVALLDPAGVKGLEFDAVIVVEPAEIVEAEHGLRHLYVAMTRAVQHLGIIHRRPMPAAIA
ncbi:MAG: HelD family protein [Acidimicrobiales bacterium]